LSTSKEQKIINEARKYVDAARLYNDISRHISSVQQRYLSQLLQARDKEQHAEIIAKLREEINWSTDEAVKRISPPIIVLNGLIEATDEPAYFTHHGRQLRVVPKNDTSTPHQRFGVEREVGGSWTLV
jgi:hypothetical protein